MCFSMLVKRRVTVRKCYPNCYPFLCHLLSVVFLSVISLTACTHWLITSCILFGLLLARLSALEYWPCLSGRPSLEPNMEPACSNRCSQRPRMRRWWHNRSKKKSYQPVIGRLQRLMQRAFQKRTQYACIHRGSEKLSLISTMRNEAQLIVIQKATQRQGRKVRFRAWLIRFFFQTGGCFRRVEQTKQLIHAVRSKKYIGEELLHKVFTFCQYSSENTDVFPMSVFPGGIPVVTIIMTVQKILHIQFIQFTLTDNFLPISKRGFLQQGKKFITFISDIFVRFVCQSLVLKKGNHFYGYAS